MCVLLLSSYYASLGDLIHVPGLGHRHLHPQSHLAGPTSPLFTLHFAMGINETLTHSVASAGTPSSRGRSSEPVVCGGPRTI